MLPAPENNFVVNQRPKPPKTTDPNEPELQHYAALIAYTAINLPVLTTHCASVRRQNFSGIGTTFDYNFTRGIAFDSTFNGTSLRSKEAAR